MAILSFPAWKISLWVLDGFIPKPKVKAIKETDKSNLSYEKEINKNVEYLKVFGAFCSVLLFGGVLTVFSELTAAIVLFIGLMAVVLMWLNVYQGGRAFD
jgi:hypothetical protein